MNEEIQELIRERNASFVTNGMKLEITCMHGHVFEKTKYQVNNGEWCPECFKNIYLNEEKCKYILEELTGKPFVKTRKVLPNHLELDMYNEELKVALEYQGAQHYEYSSFFYQTREDFQKRLEVDEFKRRTCKEMGIYLIEVPYTKKFDDEKVEFILNLLKENHVPIVKEDVYWNLFYESNFRMNAIRELARERKGKCLATSYIDNATPVMWECEYGHQWEASPNSIQSGSWCRECGTNSSREKRRTSLEEIQEMARKRNGIFLEGNYENASAKVEWQCENGHTFIQSISAVQQGSWCTKCTGTSNHTIAVLQEKAEQLNGICLSTEYHGNRGKHLFQCENGHVWLATANKALSGSWCHICGGNKPIGIIRIHEFAKRMGGVCRSDAYKNNTTKMDFTCEHGHEFQRTLAELKKRRSWCPQCHEKLTDAHAEWLSASVQTEKEKAEVFQAYKEMYKEKKRKPKKKTETALKREVFLEDLKKLKENHSGKGYSLEFMRNVAFLRNGELLDSTYEGIMKQYTWKCDQNHTFPATGSNVMKGKWCPYCANLKVDIKDMQALAEKNGGKLISPEFINARTKYTWECEEGHRWEAVWGSIKNGSWCPDCNGTTGRVTLELAQETARKQGGECLSTTYETVNTSMEWKCSKGHTFPGTYNNIRRGRWCPYCSGKKVWEEK